MLYREERDYCRQQNTIYTIPKKRKTENLRKMLRKWKIYY